MITMNIHTQMHAHTYTHTHKCMHTRTHTHTHTLIHTHTHTHTHSQLAKVCEIAKNLTEECEDLLGDGSSSIVR